MKTIVNLSSSSWLRALTVFSALVLSGLLFVSALIAGKVVDPGPEADGVYSCGNQVKGKYHELGKLEIKGKTYATYSDKDVTSQEKKPFDSFTTDGRGHIKWSAPFHFLSYLGSVDGSSEYSLDDGEKPSILVNYSDNHQHDFMVCTKAK